MVKKDMYPLGKTIEDAYNSSNNLALEVVYTEADIALMEKYRATRNYEGNDNVYNHLSNEGKKKLDDLAKEVNINMDTNKTLKLFDLTLNLQMAEYEKLGYSLPIGIDTYFVVAGAAHYVGDDSVVKLLEKKGYTVKRG